MKRFRLAACAITFFSVAALSASAGRAQTTPAQPERAGGLAVEIAHADGRRVYVLANRSVWFANFQPVAGWQRPAHVPPVQAVQVATRLKDKDTLRVTLSVRLGERYLDEDRAVATYEAREGDALAAEGLREFGVVPLGLKVVRTRPTSAPPFVETGVPSLELLAVEPTDASSHCYNLRLRNHSAKAVAAVQLIYTAAQDRPNEHWRHNPQNEPFAAPGAIFDLEVFAVGTGEMLPDGYAPGALRQVRINSVVFADGTYEGDARGAAWLNALWRGREVQLKRLLPLVARALASPETDAAVAEFRARAAALAEQAAAGELDALLPQFARLDAATKNRMRASYDFSLHHVKLDLLDALRRFEEARRDQPGRFTRRQWFEGVKGNYERWLARL